MSRFLTYVIIFFLIGLGTYFFKTDIQKLFLKTDISGQGKANPKDFADFVRRGDTESVYYYLKAGMDPDTSWLNEPVLLIALYEKHFEIANHLLEVGANPNAVDDNGKTALMWAASLSDYPDQSYELVQLLLSKGADRLALDQQNKTALDYAWANSNVSVSALLEQNAQTSQSATSNFAPDNYARAQELVTALSTNKTEKEYKELMRLGDAGIQAMVDGLTGSNPAVQHMSRFLLSKAGKIPLEHQRIIAEEFEDTTKDGREPLATAFINSAQSDQDKLRILKIIIQDDDSQIIHVGLKQLGAMGKKAEPAKPLLRQLMNKKPEMRRAFQNTIFQIDK